MDIDYQKIIDDCQIEVKVSDNPKILARVNIDLKSPPVVIKGFTIKQNAEGVVFASAPSFRNFKGTNSPIVWMPNELWSLLTARIIFEYRLKTQGETDDGKWDANDPTFQGVSL